MAASLARSLFRSTPTPSTSTSPLPSLRTFTTSTTSLVSVRVLRSRARKRDSLRIRARLQQEAYLSRPHPVLGYPSTAPSTYADSYLSKVLLDRSAVWAGSANAALPQATNESGLIKKVKEPWTPKEWQDPPVPELLNFGLNKKDSRYLATLLPSAEAEYQVRFGKEKVGRSTPSEAARSQNFDVTGTTQQTAEEVAFDQPRGAGRMGTASPFEKARRKEEDVVKEQQVKRASLLRVVDLRNAASEDINKENVRRITRTFGKGVEKDTGNPVVQAAILTHKIQYLVAHLRSLPKDVKTKKALYEAVHRRAKVLRYLKKQDAYKWKSTIDSIGISGGPPAGVGEIVLKKGEETKHKR